MQSQGLKRHTPDLAMMKPIPKRKKIKLHVPSQIASSGESHHTPKKITSSPRTPSSLPSYSEGSPPKNLIEMKKMKRSWASTPRRDVCGEQPSPNLNGSPGKDRHAKSPRIIIRRKMDSAPKEEESSKPTRSLKSPISASLSSTLYIGSNIAEKVKLLRRKASLKVSEPHKIQMQTKPKKCKSKTANKLRTKVVAAAEKKTDTTAEKTAQTNVKKKHPLRISLKMNFKNRSKLTNTQDNAKGALYTSQIIRKKLPSVVQIRRKKKKRATISHSSSDSEESSSGSSSSETSSSSSGTSSSSSDSDSSDNSSSDSGSRSDSDSSTSDSDSDDDNHLLTMRARHRKKVAAEMRSTPTPKLNIREKAKVRNSKGDLVQEKRVIYQEGAVEKRLTPALKLKIRGKQKLRKLAQEKEEVECTSEKCADLPKERPLTAAEIRAILGEDAADVGDANNNFVRRSTRQPSLSAITAPNVRAVVGKLQMNDPDMVVLKCKKYLPDSDTPSVIVDALLDALESNTNCQALYIQNFNTGMCDEQFLHLLRVLQLPSCKIWCLNIGETYKVKRRTWAAFTNGLKKTNITHMYASEHTISSAIKEKIRETIRNNRMKHKMHIDPRNLDVIVQCTHCWWNPINAKVLQPYVRQRGYEHILLDKVVQGTKDAVTDTSI
eukprot:scaffold664_cov238-Chaetoceros_neogracile.AAC.5